MKKAATELTTLLKNATDKHVPMHRPSPRLMPCCIEDIQREREHLHSALKNWKIERDKSTWEDYHDQCHSFFRTIRTVKRKHGDKFLAEASGKDIFPAMKYSMPRRCEKTSTLCTPTSTGNSFMEKAAMFRRTLFPPQPEIRLTQAEARSTRNLPWNKATREEIAMTINTSALLKAPGPDGIGFRCIQQTYKAIPDRFNKLYSTLVTTGYHPKSWREAVVVVIPKLGK